jgi:lipid A ethanolaminephosphotransferase
MRLRIGPTRAWKVEPHWLNLGVAIWLVAVPNFPFWIGSWRAMGGWSDGSVLFKLTLPLAVLSITLLVIELVTWGRLAKPVLVLFVLLAGAISYFIFTFGIVIDKDMIANVMQTDVREARDLVTWRFAFWLVVFALLPATLLALVKAQPFGSSDLMHKGLAIVAAISCLVVVVGFHGKSYASFLRNHRELRLQVVPMNAVWAVYGYVKRELSSPPGLTAVGLGSPRFQCNNWRYANPALARGWCW